MPSGLKRFQKAEALHFITFSCFHRFPLLDSPGSKDTVEAVLELTRARHQARVYAYVLMPEHVHLLINEPPSILLAGISHSPPKIVAPVSRPAVQRASWPSMRPRQVRNSGSSRRP
jgi:REP element-mobilizing transposase RayT